LFSLLTLLPIMIALGAGGAAAAPAQVAELVLRGGKIVTVDDDIQQAEAIAVAGDTILAVGGDDHIGAFIGPETRVIELEGQLAIPGFIESHAHFASMGEAGSRLNLTETSSWEEIVAMVARAVGEADPGEWIAGRGWHQDKWVETPAGSVEGRPSPPLPERGVAAQSGRPAPRQRALPGRQRQGDGAGRHFRRERLPRRR
jgi:hypothetical protein